MRGPYLKRHAASLYGLVHTRTDVHTVPMDISTGTRRVKDNVRTAVLSHPASLASIAEAADMPEVDLKSRLSGDEDLTVNDLVRVGGFLRCAPALFLEGADA